MNGIVYPYGSSHLIDNDDETFLLENQRERINRPTEENAIKATTLIQLSGGIDSTYILWKWLKENPDEYCVVHHINMINYEKRNQKELEAVDKILRWLDSQGLKNYFYLQNTFDYGNFTSVVFDVEVCGFNAGIILRSSRWNSVKNVILPVYSADVDREYRRREVMSIMALREIDVFYPICEMEKWQLIDEIPKELLELTWWCRAPYNDNPCKRCFTCQAVENSLKKIEELNLLKFIDKKKEEY